MLISDKCLERYFYIQAVIFLCILLNVGSYEEFVYWHILLKYIALKYLLISKTLHVYVEPIAMNAVICITSS